MNDLMPYLEKKGALFQMGALLLLILVLFVILNILGILLAIPFFGLDYILKLSQAYDYTNKTNINFLKYMQIISQFGLFILPAYCFAYLYNRKPMQYLALNSWPGKDSLGISILIIVVAIPFVNYLVGWNEQMSLPEYMSGIENWMREMESQAALMTNAFLHVDSLGGLVVNLLIIALFAAIGEELLFRGVLLKILLGGMKNIHLAVIISAVIFSAFHGQFYGFIPRAILGLLFGYIYVWSGSLWIPILLHLLFNSVSVIVAYLYEIGEITTNYEEFGESPSIWIVGVSLMLTIALMYMLRKRSFPKAIELQEKE